MTDMYRAAVKQLLEAELCCPHCGAQNAERRLYVTLEPNGTAACSVCSRVGSVEDFRQQEPNR